MLEISLSVISFWNELKLICLYTNNFNYYILTLTILFNINHLFADSEVVTSIAI